VKPDRYDQAFFDDYVSVVLFNKAYSERWWVRP